MMLYLEDVLNFEKEEWRRQSGQRFYNGAARVDHDRVGPQNVSCKTGKMIFLNDHGVRCVKVPSPCSVSRLKALWHMMAPVPFEMPHPLRATTHWKLRLI